MFLKPYFAKFLQYIESMGYTEQTLEGYSQHIKSFFKYIEDSGIEDLAEINNEVALNYQLSLIAGGENMAVNTQANRLSVVRSFFRYLVKTNQILYDPSSVIELPKKRRQLPRGVMTVKEINRLLNKPSVDSILGLRDKAMLEVLYATGVRNAELRSLRIADINTVDQSLTVYQGKGRKDRIVPLGGIAANYLDEYMRYSRPHLVKNKDQNLIFVTKNGNQIAPEDLGAKITKYAQLSNIKKHITPHSLRHTCATHLLKNGASIRHIQELLGHDSIESTQIYTHIAMTDLKTAHKRYHPREKR